MISDNHSSDATKEICHSLEATCPSIVYVRPEAHVPTAEQNLLFALSQCSGEYVWVLGDDDDPLLPGIELLVAYVHAREIDMVVFNSQSHAYDGERLRLSRIPCTQPSWRGDLRDFVKLTGFWFVLAGFSTLLLRRPQDKLLELKAHLSISKIYSHVTWLIEVFSGQHFAFCNTPLVSYRQNYTDVVPNDHWQRVAAREGTFFKSLWTNNFLRLIDRLVAKDILSRRDLRLAVDRHIDHRFIFVYEMLKHFIEQLVLHSRKSDPGFGAKELSYFVSWGRDLFPDYSNLTIALFTAESDYMSLGYVDAQVLERLWLLLIDRHTTPWYFQFFVERLGPYDLFQHVDQAWAVRGDAHVDIAFALDCIAPVSVGAKLLVTGSLPELRARVATQLEYIDDDALHAYALAGPPRRNFEPFDQMVNRLGAIVIDRKEIDHLRHETSRLTTELASMHAECQKLRDQADAFASSTSWRMTQPLRSLIVLLRRS